MVLASVNLPHCSAHAWPILPNHDEQAFSDKPDTLASPHDLHMGETLTVCADLVLTLDD